ncbi:hypothetical protein WMZ97_18965 [Lentibacillus sp. N15]|uniref:hypothetical protein n=1 Tax=Lentibacillus songyuanensis TaxID=3136161 RepID=UPI0031BB6DDE
MQTFLLQAGTELDRYYAVDSCGECNLNFCSGSFTVLSVTSTCSQMGDRFSDE